MLELDAARFMTLCQALQSVQMGLNLRGLGVAFGQPEKRVEPPWFFRHIAGFLPGHDAVSRKLDASIAEVQRVSAENNAAMHAALKDSVAALGVILKEMGLQLSLVELRRLERRLSEADYAAKPDEIETLSSRIRDELHGHLFFQVNPTLIRFYEPADPPFGQEVADKLPSLIYEIQEAGNCYALERNTASVFHSIRCLEGGIRALSRCLQIPDPTKAHERSWMKLLNTLKAAIDQKWPTSSDRLSGDGEFFENAYAALAAMQNPWRNATMHLDQKYDAEEAKHFLDVVGGFMRKLASRCDELGQPTA